MELGKKKQPCAVEQSTAHKSMPSVGWAACCGSMQHCSFAVISICHLKYQYTCQMQKRGPGRAWGMKKRKLIIPVTMYTILMWNRTSVIFQGTCTYIYMYAQELLEVSLWLQNVWLKRILIRIGKRTAGTLIAVMFSSGCLLLDHSCSCFYLLLRSCGRFEEPLAAKVNISSALLLYIFLKPLWGEKDNARLMLNLIRPKWCFEQLFSISGSTCNSTRKLFLIFLFTRHT